MFDKKELGKDRGFWAESAIYYVKCFFRSRSWRREMPECTHGPELGNNDSSRAASVPGDVTSYVTLPPFEGKKSTFRRILSFCQLYLYLKISKHS